MYNASGQSKRLAELVSRAALELGADADNQDALLNHYAVKAADTINRIRRHTPTDDAPVEPQFENVLIDMVVFSFAKRGAEGQTGHTENGLGRSYEGGSYPTSLLARVTPKVHSIPIEG